MKVGIIADVTRGSGGVYQYTAALLKCLSLQKDIDLIVFSPDSDIKIGAGIEVRHYRRPRSLVDRVLRLFSLYVRINSVYSFLVRDRHLFNDIDLILSPVITDFPHAYLPTPFVLTIHDLQERYYPNFFSITERVSRYILNQRLANRSSHILCEASCVRADIMHFLGIAGDRISVVPLPPPKFLHSIEDSPVVAESIKNLQSSTYILYPSQFWPHKNHKRFLVAFKNFAASHPHIKLVLTGQKTRQYSNILKLVKKLGLTEMVFFPGYVSDSDLNWLFRHCLFVAIPSLFESISIPLFEAFSFGKAVACSNVCGLPEQSDGNALLFDPRSEKDMTEALVLLTKNDDFRESLARRGKIVLSRKTEISQGKQLVSVLSKLVPHGKN